MDRLCPDHGRQHVVHDEVGIEDDHLFARIQQGEHGQHQAAAGAGGDEYLAVGMSVLLGDAGLEFFAQHGHALREGVAVSGGFGSPRWPPGGPAPARRNPVARWRVDGSRSFAPRSKTLRMPEESNRRVRSASQCSDMT